MSQLTSMLKLIALAHDGQLDKGNAPYVLHPIAVMQLLKTTDEELMCIALGHDLLEDTDVTAEFLRGQRFSERIVSGIEALTKVKGQSAKKYKGALIQNKDAIRVKIADLTHNLDESRLTQVTDKDIARRWRYQALKAELENILRRESL